MSASVSGSKLNVSGGQLVVKKIGAATFTEADIKNAGAVVSGNLTLNGKYTSGATSAENTYGIKLAAQSIYIKETGTLTLGADAVKAISVSYDDQGSGSVTLVTNAISQDALDVQGGRVYFAFDNQTKFNSETLELLKNQLVYGDNLNNGVINVGNAEITGLTDKIDSESNTISWEDMTGYGDILEDYTQETLSQAIVTDAPAAGFKGHVGAVQADNVTNGTIELGGNASFSHIGELFETLGSLK